MLLHLSVILFTGERGCLPLVQGHVCHTTPSRQTPPPLGRHPPWVDIPILGRHPWADTPPGRLPWADTLLGRHSPGKHPLGKHSPGRHPLPCACWDTSPAQCMLGYIPCTVHAEIWPISEQYASHWKAFLSERAIRFKHEFENKSCKTNKGRFTLIVCNVCLSVHKGVGNRKCIMG